MEYLGEIGGQDKDEFLGNARALLFPIDWPEPFGLTMIEAMACGTPVIAWRCGSVPEVIDEGVTGVIVQSLGEAVAAVQQLSTWSRRRCRERFEERFSAARMAKDYTAIYQRLRRASWKKPAAAVLPLRGPRRKLASVAARTPAPGRKSLEQSEVL